MTCRVPLRRLARRLLPLLLALAAACQPLPHPFADDKPPAALLAVRDTAGVAIAPLVGAPAGVAQKLGGAMAKALLQRDIPASDKTANLDSYQLYGRVVQSTANDGRAAVRALWWLYDAGGKIVGKKSAEVVAASDDWRSARDAPIAQLASLSADRLAPLLEDKPPAPAAMPAVAPPATAAPEAGHLRIAIDKIAGAPGDGAPALKAALAAVLQRAGLAVAAAGRPDFTIAADVAVAASGPDQQHVRIVWHVRRRDGVEIGTVAQENDVPQGELAGKWGDVAANIAIAAEGGLMQLIARAAPPPAAAQAASKAR
jgi:hypothetical protein